MSTTENEAIAALQAAQAATDAKLGQVSTKVDSLITVSGDNPTKVAAIDAAAAKSVEQTATLQTISDKVDAALATPTAPPAA